MNKLIEVLGISDNTQWGTILGCRATEWVNLSEDEIIAWFDNYKTLSFDDGSVVEFFQVCPYLACFGNGRGHAVLKLIAPPNINIATPTIAQLSY